MKKYKIDEFVDSMCSLLPEFRKENGCLDCSVYQDFDEDHAFYIVTEWETDEAMQQHFMSQKFEVLIGAAKVLGETFEMIMAEIKEKRGHKLANII